MELGAEGLSSIQLGTAESSNQSLVCAIYSSFIPFGMWKLIVIFLVVLSKT